MSWNIQGLRPKLHNLDFIHFCNQYDIFALSEINNVTYEEICNIFINFEVFISYRKSCGGGGIAVCVKKSILSFVKHIECDIEECVFLYINISSFKKPLLATFPYIAHEGSVYYKEKILNGIENLEYKLTHLKCSNEDVHWLLGGDFNARVGQLDDTIMCNNINDFINGYEECDMINDDEEIECRKSRDTETNNYGRHLVQFCKLYDIFILNGRTTGDKVGAYTCIANGGRSVVDYFITGRSFFNYITDMSVVPRPESDHFPIILNISCTPYTLPTPSIETEICNPIGMLKWNKKYEQVYNEILNEQFDLYHNELLSLIPVNINHAINRLNEFITYAAKHVQMNCNRCSNFKNNVQAPWFDHECKMLKKDKYDKLHIFHKTGSQNDLEEYLILKKKFKNLCNMKKVKYNDKKAESLIEKFVTSDSKGFWGELKLLIRKKPIMNNFNQIRPYQWFSHFKKLLGGDGNEARSIHENETTSTPNNEINSNDNFLNEPITYEEIIAGIGNLKKDKASGCDGIKAEFYKVNNPNLVYFIQQIFNQIFESGVYPETWSKCMIVPLHKKGDLTDVSNYRGISLLNIMSKIFSHILNERLKLWCEDNNLIPEEQAGFRKGYCTVDNIFSLNALVQKYISKPKGRFYALFVDFKVCFDSINRRKLWNVLSKDGCHGKMLNILKSMYENVMMCVRVTQNDTKVCQDSKLFRENCKSNFNVNTNFFITDCFKSLTGLKQGCILSPILFNLFIKELNDYFCDSSVRPVSLLTNEKATSMLMYADDLVILSDTVFEMQAKIDLLYDFCSKWGLAINLNKTKVMVFRNGGYLKSIEKWNYGESNIEVTSYYAYLGMIFSSRLCWSQYLENLSLKALRIVGVLRKMFNKFNNLPLDLAFRIFDTKIKPLVLYGSQIWGCGYFECIEKVQIQFCKAYLGIGKTTPNDLAIHECGRQSLSIDYNISVIKYWTKLVHMPIDRYPRKCYEQMKQHDIMGRKNWVTCTKKLLFTLGFGKVWQDQDNLCDSKLFLIDFKYRLKDIDLQELHAKINEKSDIYINFKYCNFYPSIECMPYLNLIRNFIIRRTFTLLRTHSLPIKNNLFRLNLVNNNLCEKCHEEGVYVENEFHVLFRCKAYAEIRQDFIPNLFTYEPTLQKMHQLLTTQDINLITNTSHFIAKVLKDR